MKRFFWLSVLLLFTSCSDVETKSVVHEESKNVAPKVVHSAEDYLPQLKLESPQNFRDVTEQFGLKGVEGVAFFAVDFNNDRYTDLVVLPNHYSIPRFFQFDASLNKYVELPYSPLGRDVWASLMVFYDFNRDGVIDVILGAPKRNTALDQHPLRLFLGRLQKGKITFRYKPNVFPKEIYSTFSIAPLDVDLDGNLDLYLGNWYEKFRGKLVVRPDRLYYFQKGKFIDNSAILLGETDYQEDVRAYPNARPTYGAAVCDVDLNGYPDVLTAASNGMRNKMWLNLSDPKMTRKFVDYGVMSNYANDQDGYMDRMGGGDSYFSRCFDYNNDGLVDVIIGELTHSYDAPSRDRSAVLTGSTYKFPPKFIRTEYFLDDGSMFWNQGDKSVSFLDFNLDGLIDMAVDNNGFPPQSRFILFEQQSDHSFVDHAKEFGIDLSNPSGSITLDFNRDGRPDLLVGQVSVRAPELIKRVYLLENVTEPKGHSLKINLLPKKSNPLALGATVRLKTDKSSYLKFHYPFVGGFSSQDESGLTFGVPFNETVKWIEVTWPIADKSGKALKKRYKLGYKLNKNTVLNLTESGKIK